MAIVALLSAHHCTGGAEPWSSLVVGGLPVVGRQMRQAKLAGVERAVVKVEGNAPECLAALERAGLVIVHDGPELADAIGTDDVLLFAEGLVVDDRIVRQIFALDGAALAVWSGGDPPEAERIDHETCWAGLARIPGAVVATAALTLGDWDMQSTLLRATSALGPARLDIGSLGRSASDPGAAAPPLWVMVRSPQAARLLTDLLLQATGISSGTWVKRFVQAPVATFLTRWLLPTRVSPVLIRIGATGIALAVGPVFAAGWPVAGLALAIIPGFLGCIADNLARVRLELYSRKDWWDTADRVIGYSWFLCLGGWLAGWFELGTPLLLAVILILFSVAAHLQRTYFHRLSGRHLHDCGPFERRLGLLSADRDTCIWLLLPFTLSGHWHVGLAVLAVYACLLFFVTQARIFGRLGKAG